MTLWICAGAAIPGTCQPNPQQLPRSFQATCDALKIVVPQECADLWQVFNENSLEAFGPVAAEALGADYQVIATSGSGTFSCLPKAFDLTQFELLSSLV